MSETYYMVNSRWQVRSAPMRSKKSQMRKAVGNYFETKEEANAFAEALKRLRVKTVTRYTAYLEERPRKIPVREEL